MKLKQKPEDFRVEEIAEMPLGGGPFALYRLAKSSLGTPEAISAVCRAWGVPRDAVNVGGLKDRHAATRQYLSIENGPRRNLGQTNLTLEYLGQTVRPFDSKDILANRFEIVIRDLKPRKAEHMLAALPQAIEQGVPNYFDDQRFGSVGLSGEFIARDWCLGDYPRALWLALAESNVHDRPEVRDEKKILREVWGDWISLRRSTVRPVVRLAVEHLGRRPLDFRGAFVLIPQHERRLYLEAFQSFLWNRILSESIRALFNPSDLFETQIARTAVPFYRVAPAPSVCERLAAALPLPSARGRSELGPLAELYERVAAEFGLSCRTLRVKYPRDSFFSRGDRAAVFYPGTPTSTVEVDEQDASLRTLLLRFDLPPGCYATVLIKRLAEAP